MSIAQSAQKLRETGQSTMFDLFGEEVATPLAGIALETAPVPKGGVTEVLLAQSVSLRRSNDRVLRRLRGPAA